MPELQLCLGPGPDAAALADLSKGTGPFLVPSAGSPRLPAQTHRHHNLSPEPDTYYYASVQLLDHRDQRSKH